MNIKMNVMDLQADIKWILEELKDVKDPTFIEAIKNMLKYRKKMSSTERITIEQYNKELDKSIADIAASKVHSHEDVKAMIQQWRGK